MLKLRIERREKILHAMTSIHPVSAARRPEEIGGRRIDSLLPISAYSTGEPLAYPWMDWAADIARAGREIATAPIDLRIARIRAVYAQLEPGGDNVPRFRGDWDAAFGGTTLRSVR